MNLQRRINFQGELKLLLTKVCGDYKIGSYYSHEPIVQGYEDFNLILITDKGRFFVKIYGSFRDKNECKRYVEVIQAALKAGVSHPKLYQSNQGYLYEIQLDEKDRLSVFEYIDGKTLFELNLKPKSEEVKFFIKQATIINNIQLKPDFIYDSWAIVNFLKEYKGRREALTNKQNLLITPVVNDFENIDLNKLPHAFVHGDLIKTNLMKDKTGRIYIIDFAVANYYPRIIELAVLFNDTFFDKDSLMKTKDYFSLALSEYQKYIPLTKYELEILPLFVKAGHAMHLLRANYEKVINKNNSKGNEYFLNLGMNGLTHI